MPIQKHAHKFLRHSYKTGGVIYFCALPDCTVKIKPALTLGKRAICWRCGSEFTMTDYSIRLVKPHCENCHNPKGKGEKSYTNSADLSAMHPELLTKSNDDISEMKRILAGNQDEEGEI